MKKPLHLSSSESDSSSEESEESELDPPSSSESDSDSSESDSSSSSSSESEESELDPPSSSESETDEDQPILSSQLSSINPKPQALHINPSSLAQPIPSSENPKPQEAIRIYPSSDEEDPQPMPSSKPTSKNPKPQEALHIDPSSSDVQPIPSSKTTSKNTKPQTLIPGRKRSVNNNTDPKPFKKPKVEVEEENRNPNEKTLSSKTTSKNPKPQEALRIDPSSSDESSDEDYQPIPSSKTTSKNPKPQEALRIYPSSSDESSDEDDQHIPSSKNPKPQTLTTGLQSGSGRKRSVNNNTDPKPFKKPKVEVEKENGNPNKKTLTIHEPVAKKPLELLPLVDSSLMAPTLADVKEYENSYVLDMDMAGLKYDDIKVEVEDENMVVISGERKREEGGGVKYLRMERRVGKFMRNFVLPENANIDSLSALCQDGLLSVTVLKKLPPPFQPNKPRRIIEVLNLNGTSCMEKISYIGKRKHEEECIHQKCYCPPFGSSKPLKQDIWITPMMQIFVKGLDGNTFILSVKSSDRIINVKKKIFNRDEIPVHDQR